MSVQEEIERLNSAKDILKTWCNTQSIPVSDDASITQIANTIAEVTIPDMSNYYTKTEIDSLLKNKAPIANIIDYAEVKTGRKINGKDVYAKRISFTTPSTTNKWTTISTMADDVTSIVSFNVWITANGAEQYNITNPRKFCERFSWCVL